MVRARAGLARDGTLGSRAGDDRSWQHEDRLFQAAKTRAVQGERAGWHRMAWLTDKKGFAAAQEHLKSLGVSFPGPVDYNTTQSIYFTDPDGNPLEITFTV